ncbi:MAG: hypothetical protein WC869_06785 [Phycisphaerae bacterium]|jgi:hypothetical protein
MANDSITRIKNQLLDELKRDKKKALTLGVLLCVGLVVFGKLIFKGVPSSAAAAPLVVAASPAPTEPALTNSADESAVDPSRDKYLREIDTTIQRDIFSAPAGLFPSGVAASVQPDNHDEAAKAADDQVRGMTLQSTILSASPTAIINGKVLKIGSQIGGFQVMEITSGSVTLEKADVKVVLEMKGS